MPDLTTILATALEVVRPPDPEFAEEAAAASGLSVNWPGWAQAIVAAIPDVEREALAFGLAWLRVTRAKPDGWAIHLDSDLDLSSFRASTESFSPGRGQVQPFEVRYGPTPTAALTALAEALEARHG